MIDHRHEHLLTLAQAAATLPRFSGKRIHVSTIYRWSSRGLRGVRLETLRVGGRMCTSEEALQRFFERLSDPAPGQARPSLSEAARRAEEEADELGL